MKFFLFFTIVFSVALSVAAKKRDHQAHAHGEGKFTLAIEGYNLEIEMEIPADDIVGFEHQPKTQKQKKAVETAKEILKKSDEIVVLPVKSQCKSTSVKVESPFAQEDHRHHDDDEKEDAHSEFHIRYKFKCSVPKYLSRITLDVFKFFPSLKELNGQAVTMGGQFSKELTTKQNTFTLYK